MEDETSVLERILDGAEEPKDLPLAVLKSITNDFSKERRIGQGGFGEGELRNKIVAVKRMFVNEHTVDDKAFRREIYSLMSTNHQNVVRFLGFCSLTRREVIKHPVSGERNLVNINERLLCSEYISNGSLDKLITDELRGLKWEMRYEIITGICKGLHYLHEDINIIHMDLKPPNILLDDHMVPKITDFGLSRQSKNSRIVGLRFGTQGYFAPEYGTSGKTSLKCDIYSLGAIITELVTGCIGAPNKNNDFFFLGILAGYIFLMFGVLKHYELLYAVAAIAFMSPYFVLMLKALPLLKGFYIEKYAKVDAHLP